MKATFAIAIVLLVVVGTCWITNLVKLTNCDFASPYRCEAIHAAGLIPPVSLVTVWMASDAE